ncbi:MAG: hypothetical protein KDB01_23240, partial [Planctomycetaceae bacterium]|nr:hypothetical protein [Planctomycetaceae bacterium]
MNQQPQESAVSENSEEVSGNVVGANSKSEGQPAFIVGVTGHMDPTDPERLTRQVEQLFRFLRHGVSGGASGVGATPHQSAASELKAALAPLVGKAPEFPGHSNKVHGDVYERFFAEWPGLGETPIVVLSSLAPGADQIVAKVALQPEFANDYFRLMCPLPVPLEMYRQASTFVRQPQVGATEEELERLKSENDQRVSDLRQLIPDDDDPRCFPVAIRNAFTPGDLSNSLCGATVEEQIELLQDDLDLSEDQRNRLYSHDLKSENRQRRHRRYQAAGEYIAAYSHLLIAIWDHIDDTKNTEGTAGIVHA